MTAEVRMGSFGKSERFTGSAGKTSSIWWMDRKRNWSAQWTSFHYIKAPGKLYVDDADKRNNKLLIT